MSNIEIGFSGLAILFTLILLRFPIGVSMIGVSFGGIWMLIGERAAWAALGLIPQSFAAKWALSSVPMFLLMGFICYHTGLTKSLFDVARLWLSRLPGGLAVASVFGAAGFAAVTGSSVACSATMGKIAVPEMTRCGYSPKLATGTVAAAGTIGALIPPSILMILYGIIAQVPIGKLFLGGLAVGLLTTFAYCAVIIIQATLDPKVAPRIEGAIPMKEKLDALLTTWPLILLVIGVFGGLFSGLFTPTEAGAVGAALAIIIAMIKRSLTWESFWLSIRETLLTTATLFIIAIGASLLTRFLALSGSGDFLADTIIGFGADPLVLLIGITVVYLLMGMILDPLGAMLLTLPVLLPILDAGQFSLIWFGVLLTKYLEIGMITPPIGLNVFVIKGVVGNLASLETIFKGVIYFLIADIFIVAAMIAFPEFVLYLPNLVE